MEDGLASVSLWRPYLFAMTIGMARMLGVISILPIFSYLSLSGGFRFAVAAAISAPVIYGLPGPVEAAQIDTLWLMALVMKEVLIGIGIGMLLALPFWAIALAGGAIDFQRMAATSITSMPDGTETTVLGLFLGLVYLAYIWASGAHLLAIGVVHHSYGLWPPLTFFPLETLSIKPFSDFMQELFLLGLLLAAPIIFVLLLSDLAVAALARFAPNMNAMLLAMQVKSLIVGIMLFLYVGVMFTAFADKLSYFFDVKILLTPFGFTQE